MSVSSQNDYTSSIVTNLSVNKCLITSAVASLDFKNAVVEFAYFEDIFTNTVHGTLLVSDSSAFPNILSWCGEERLDLEISKPNTTAPDNAFSGTFRIYNISRRHLTKDDNENYLINFCSEELVISEKTRISKTYKNTKVSDIVKDIAFNYMGIASSDFPDSNIEETMGNITLTIPNMKPLEAINWLCTMAIVGDTKFGNHSGPEGGASYLFWRNRDGYNFRSLLSIFNNANVNSQHPSTYLPQLASKQNAIGYWYGIKNSDTPQGETIFDPYSQIISYEVLNSYDALEAQQRGMFCNRTISIDYVTRTYQNNDFDYTNYFNNFLKPKIDLYSELNNLPVLSTSTDRFGKTANQYPEGTIKVYPSTTMQANNEFVKQNDPNIFPNYVENTVPYRLAQLSLIGINRIKMAIPGDPYMTVGKLIDVFIPQTTTNNTGSKDNDKFLTGTYLVTCVRHSLDQENEFKTIIEITKDAYKSDISSTSGLATFSVPLLTNK
jgi:hypothetical protein